MSPRLGVLPGLVACGALLVATAALAAPSSDRDCREVASVVADATMRGAPSDDSPFLAEVVRGEVVRLCQPSQDGLWMRVILQGEPGWLPREAVAAGRLTPLPSPVVEEPPKSGPVRDDWCRIFVAGREIAWTTDAGTPGVILPGELVASCGGRGAVRQVDGARGRIPLAELGGLVATEFARPASFPFGGGATCRDMLWRATVVREGYPYDADGALIPAPLRHGQVLGIVEERDGWLRSFAGGQTIWLPSDLVSPPSELDPYTRRARMETDCPAFFRKGVLQRQGVWLGGTDDPDGSVPLNVGTELPIVCDEQDVVGGEGKDCVPSRERIGGALYYRTVYLGHAGLVPIESVAVTQGEGDYESWLVPHAPVTADDVPQAATVLAPPAPDRDKLDVDVPRLVATVDTGAFWLAEPAGEAFLLLRLGLAPATGAVYPVAAVHVAGSGGRTLVGADGGVLWEPLGRRFRHTLFAVGGTVGYDALLGGDATAHLVTLVAETWFGWKTDRAMTGVVLGGGGYGRVAPGDSSFGAVLSLRLAVGVWLGG